MIIQYLAGSLLIIQVVVFMRLVLILSAFLISVSVEGQNNLFDGLIGCYSLDGTAVDSSPLRKDGTIHAAQPTSDRFGRPSSAFAFDGSSYIQLPAAHLMNSSYSYAVWAKVTRNPSPGGSGIVFSIGDHYDSKHQTINVSNIYASDGFVGWNVGGYNNGTPTTTSLQSFNMPVLNQWYHLVITRDKSVMKMYINGVLMTQGSTNGNDPYYGTFTNAMLGIRCNYAQGFEGAIDDFVAYNRVISQGEVQELYNIGIPCGSIHVETTAECGTTEVVMNAFGAESYSWYSESGDLLFEGNPFVVNIDVPTNYTVVGSISAGDLPPLEITVESRPVPEVALHVPGSLSEGATVNLRAEITGSILGGLQWMINGVQLPSTGDEIEYTFMESGEYVVSVAVSFDNGCRTVVNEVVAVGLESPDLYKGLIRCYPLNGNADDKSTSGKRGEVFGAVSTKSRFGQEASALLFDGINDYVSIPVEGLKNKNFTYAAWAKVLANPAVGSTGIVFSIGDTDDSKHQTINVNNAYSSEGFIGWNVGGYNVGMPGTTSLQSGVLPAIDEWYHIAMTRSSHTVKMYLNGNLVAVQSTKGNEPYYGSPTAANLGLRCNFVQPFHGAIDDFVIYDRPLNSIEIQMLFEQGLPCEEVVVPDIVRCGAGHTTITASGAADYRWFDQNGVFVFAGNPFEVDITESAVYFVEGIRGEKIFPRQMVNVTVFSNPALNCSFPKAELYHDNLLSVEVVGGSPAFSFEWSIDGEVIPDQSVSTITVNPGSENDIAIAARVRDRNGCVAECSAVVEVEEMFFIPNIITVNQDDLNDSFNLFRKMGDHFYTYEGAAPFEMRIIDRWGTMVFETRDPSIGWDGLDAAFGVYFYSIGVGELSYKGWVQVIGG